MRTVQSSNLHRNFQTRTPYVPFLNALKIGLVALLPAIFFVSRAYTNDPSPQSEFQNPRPEIQNAPYQFAAQVLSRCLLESVWGKPTLCEVRQTIHAFDRQRTSFGKFVRAGQGSGRMRLSLQTPAGNQMNSLAQISDGEMLSTLVTIGDQSFRTQVDLGKVRDRLTITNQSLQDPVVAMYLAIGGQGELQRKLIQQYLWTQVSEAKWGNQKVWVIRGKATDEPKIVRSMAPVDIRLFENRSGLQPVRAELVIGCDDSDNPFWLYKVVETYRDSSPNAMNLQVVTEWDCPVLLGQDQLVPELFRLGATENQSFGETREETKLYLPPSSASVAELPIHAVR